MIKSQKENKNMTDDTFHFFLQNNDGYPLSDEVGYSTGRQLNCPTCNSKIISIFFKPGFLGIKRGKWCKFMKENDFELCNDYEVIKKSNYNPNWICKECYDGGVILKND